LTDIFTTFLILLGLCRETFPFQEGSQQEILLFLKLAAHLQLRQEEEEEEIYWVKEIELLIHNRILFLNKKRI